MAPVEWERFITNRTLGVLSVLCFAYFAFYQLSPPAHSVRGISKTKNTGTFDLDLYSPDEVHPRLEKFGPDGRQSYASLLLIDLFFPLAYVPISTLAIAGALQESGRLNGPLRWLPFIAPITGLADWTEGAALLTLIRRYPEHSDVTAAAASVATAVKLLLLALIIMFVFVGIAHKLYNRRRV
jgi:hypothetical protein